MSRNKSLFFITLTVFIIIIMSGICLLIKDNSSKLKPNNKNDLDFNSKLIREINKNEDQNYLISPYSIEIALNMLRDGANGKTKEQIDKLVSERKINDVIIKSRVNVANSAFIKNKYKENVIDEYYKKLKDKYNADILYDNFETPKVINDWVDKQTNGMIKKIIDNLDESFVMGLANAVAIDVEWQNQFDCLSTTKESFTKINNEKYDVSMMHKTYNNVKFFETDKERGIIIPYKTYDKEGKETFDEGSSLEFVGIIPNDNIKSYIDNIDKETFERIDEKQKELSNNERINLSLPIFKYRYEIKDFKVNLINLGITEVFDPVSADLSNMIKSKAENFYVSDAIHKTYIDLNEKGTKAAAVTAFIIKSNSAILEKEPKIIEMKFDKPFAYIIRDTKTKELLFFGVVYEPSKWEGSTCK